MRSHLVNRPVPTTDMADRPEKSRRHRVHNLSEHVLTWLHARRLISDRQLAAGEQLRADFARAGMMPQVTMQWDAPAPDGSPRSATSHDHRTVAMLDAKRRFDAAMAHVGPGLSDVCWRVICVGEAMAGAEQALGWPGRAGRVVLGIALDRLAEHYRVPGG